MLEAREPYAYRNDEGVPSFPDETPVVVMDGTCALCTRGARAIARLDRRGEIKFITAQSAAGRGLSTHFGLDADDPASWIYLDGGKAYGALDAVIAIGHRVGGIGHLAAAMHIIPRPARHWLYRRLALNRYAMFGSTDVCQVPDPRLRARLLF